MNTRQQEEELLQKPTPTLGATPPLFLRRDEEGDLVFTNLSSALRFREETPGGDLVPSDDATKPAAGAVRLSDTTIYLYKAL